MSIALDTTLYREKASRDAEQRKGGHMGAPSNESAWMVKLDEKFQANLSLKNSCGYIAFYNTKAQEMAADVLDQFQRTIEPFFQDVMRWNGAHRNILSQTWKMQNFNAPADVYVCTEKNVDNSALRKAFHDLTTRPEDFQENTPFGTRSPAERPHNHTGYLRNTFLVINPVCVESVLHCPRRPRVDDMRMLAFDANYPEKGCVYEQGYEGWKWVRMEQLVGEFYAEQGSEEKGMDGL
jgi:hypothetical protein